MSRPAVQLVRGPFVRLDPHPDHCETEEELVQLVERLRAEQPDVLLAADLFCGAGGLSLGLKNAGIQTVLGVDHFKEAVETHRHYFPGLTVDWDLSQAAQVERVAEIIATLGIDVLAGGPPCQPFSKAGRSGIRYRVHHGLRDPHDERRDLWRSFLETVRLGRPRAVVMENVPDMALDDEMFILRSMVEELEMLGYSVEERVLDTSEYGVPQFRQRLILVALRGAIKYEWPAKATERPTVWTAIGDLPEVAGGWRPEGGAQGFLEYEGPVTDFQKYLRSGVDAADENRIFDHITRPVRDDDKLAFDSMDSTTKYSDLDDEFKRYREDIFDDKYKRLDEDQVSRTITAHIAKDGYWYIHPRQPRTITVREAARLQTFPDWYRFAGPPTAAFKQIGNAVPPLAAEHVGRAIRASLERGNPEGPNTRQIAQRLAEWFRASTQLSVPWLRAETQWQAVSAEILLDRADRTQVQMVWNALRGWRLPLDTLANAAGLTGIGRLMGREQRALDVLSAAKLLSEHSQEGNVEPASKHIPEAAQKLALLVSPSSDEDEPVLITKGALRPARRYIGEGEERRNQRTDGRLAVARMVGGGTDFREAHLALIELANSLCRPQEPVCTECPLFNSCAHAAKHFDTTGRLF